jgi:hypothetical protein
MAVSFLLIPLPVRASSSASLGAGLDLTVDPSSSSRSLPPRSESEGGRHIVLELAVAVGGAEEVVHAVPELAAASSSNVRPLGSASAVASRRLSLL